MNDSEPTLKFFDYIYPVISRKLVELEKRTLSCEHHLIEIEEKNKHLLLEMKQYKNKIQRIEQFLIKNGLIRLLKNNDKD